MAAPKAANKSANGQKLVTSSNKTSSKPSKKAAPTKQLHATRKTQTSIHKPISSTNSTAARLSALGLSSIGSSSSSSTTTSIPSTQTRITGSTKARDDSLKTELDASLGDVLSLLNPRSKKMRASRQGGTVVWAGEDVDLDGSSSVSSQLQAMQASVAEEERRRAQQAKQSSFEKVENDMQSALDLLTKM